MWPVNPSWWSFVDCGLDDGDEDDEEEETEDDRAQDESLGFGGEFLGQVELSFLEVFLSGTGVQQCDHTCSEEQ